MADLSKVLDLLTRASGLGEVVSRVTLAVEAGTELARVVQQNIAEAKATGNARDVAELEAMAARLAQANRSLAVKLDAELGG